MEEELVREAIREWNPWWQAGTVPETKQKILRHEHLDALQQIMNTREIIVLSGVRRSGKSTLLYQLIQTLLDQGVPKENIFYFNLDDPLTPLLDDPLERLMQTYEADLRPKGKKYLFFDEIQNVKEWTRWMKKRYDLDE